MKIDGAPIIEIDDAFVLHRGRTRDVAALRGMSVRVMPGERVVVRGPSGSGKSTLVAAVTGQVHASAGRVLLFGHDMAQLDHAEALQLRTMHVGVVSQRAGLDLLDDLDCLDNVALQGRLAGASRSGSRAEAIAALQRLGLEHLAARRPSSLSGGERQRIALAAALAHSPGLVIADEPTGELDALSADQVYDFLRDDCERTGAALLVVTHDERAERIATRVVTVHDGRVSQEQANGREALLIDRRGWVRLPDALRSRAGVTDHVVAEASPGEIRLAGWQPVAVSSEEEPTTTTSPGAVAVRVRDAEIRLETVTVGPVSMELHRGEITVITGRSGSGKTTMLGGILGTADPNAGSIERLVETTACAPQTAAFADQQSLTANVDLVRALRDLPPVTTEVNVLGRLGLGGLEARPAGALSGGERQRLAVARALSSEAELVVLDEPTSQLDRGTAQLVARAVRECADAGACIVCASHDEALIAVADHVVDLGSAHQLSAA